mmetsp:Transcript_7288/g.10316  ORF Transcript_7288/g.10316 Transcript_7288/m.10316 type:complete len:244 (-) Transcript_7288:30-761(-)
MATSSSGKDLYKVLNVSKTATQHEIKMAYRKLAMALHPDKNDGCTDKANEFKIASDAYDTLSDNNRRKAYDSSMLYGTTQNARKPPPPNYRKVYAPKPPPNFKIFDETKHFEMHYGTGMMKDEVDRARKRAEAASGRDASYDYKSPLGEGFTFGDHRSADNVNPYSKAPQGPPPKTGGYTFEYEEAHFFDQNGSDLNNAKRVIRSKEIIKERMYDRRKERIERRQRQAATGGPPQTEEGCIVM